MDVQSSESSTMARCSMPSTCPSLIVLTSVDGTVCRGGERAFDDVRRAMTFLETRGVPVVFVSSRRPATLMTLQQAFGTRVPFVSDGGATLHIPTGYFRELPGFGRDDGAWTVVECARTRRPPASDGEDRGPAVRLLVSLYRAGAGDAVTIGVGSCWRDHMLLREVDVPVIVRRDDVDQDDLRRAFPSAYVTTALGPAGWSEAMLGAPDV